MASADIRDSSSSWRQCNLGRKLGANGMGTRSEDYSGLPKHHRCNYHVATYENLQGTVKRYGMSYNRCEFYVTVFPDGSKIYAYSSQYGEAPRTVKKKSQHHTTIEQHFNLTE